MRVFVLFAIITLSGCSIMGPIASKPMQTYTLAASYSKYQPRHRKNITLMVSMPTASSGYQSKKMIYNKKPFELNAFTKNQWAGPPAEMITPLLLQYLRDTGYFHAIIQPPISARRNIRLKINLLELRQDFTSKPSKVNMAIQADLIDEKNSKILNSKVFATSYFAPCDTPYGGVIAANRATNKLLQQIANFCVHSMMKRNVAMNTNDANYAENTLSQTNKLASNPQILLPIPHLLVRGSTQNNLKKTGLN